jgi:putative aldouronate transport system substrate-binding protein
MKARVKKSIASITTGAIAISSVMLIGGNANAAQKLDFVKLNVYVMGEQPIGNNMPSFYKEFDKLTKKDLNCTVNFKFSTWTDWATKYNLMLTSGEQVDLAYAADWVTYSKFAAKGAYQPLDKLIPKYAPKLWKSIPKSSWNALKVNGHIYGVPCQYKEFVQHGATYREDLRLKYKLPKITSVATLEKYLETIKAKEPGMSLPIVESRTMKEMFVPSTKNIYIDSQDEFGTIRGLVVDPKNISKSINYYATPEYLKMIKVMKSWADKGFWSKSILSSQENAGTDFENGKTPIIMEQHSGKCKGEAETIAKKHPSWKIGYFNYNDMNGNIYPCRADHNLMAVPKQSKNAERALMLLEKLQNDKAYADLSVYGVKGKNYNLTKDGKLDYSKIDTVKNPFDIAPWGWRNDQFMRENAAQWSEYTPLVNRLKSVGKSDPMEGFVYDSDKMAAKIAAISQVESQYAAPLEVGAMKDVDGAYKTLLNKLKEAGIDDLKADVDKQLKAFAKRKAAK